MKLPAHIHEISGDSTASSPYNFVPLPEKVVRAVDDPAKLVHNSFSHKDYPHSGYFEVTLTTKAPLYVRGPLTLDEFISNDDKSKNKPDFFHTRPGGGPVIPGSSLRGMLRSLLEIAGYGKMQGVSTRKLFFRSVGNEAVGKYYRKLAVNFDDLPRRRFGGFVRVTDRKWEVEECDVFRVTMDNVARAMGVYRHNDSKPWKNLYTNLNPSGKPKGDFQHQKVWIKPGATVTQTTIRRRNGTKEADGELEGVLLLTGPINNKRRVNGADADIAFVFVPKPKEERKTFKIPNDRETNDENEQILDRFNDDQMTQWQRRAFPDNGRLRDGDPVFCIVENERLVFLGRAYLFRLPYQHSPRDFVPESLRRPDETDYAEALFGFVAGGDQTREPVAGRVSVTDATLNQGQQDIWLFDQPIKPRILSTPKPTSIQHYLVQKTKKKDELAHYGSKPLAETVIRGFKRYWHQDLGEGRPIEEIRQAIEENRERLNGNNREEGKEDTQHTLMKPIRHGVSFTFRVHFDNLSDRELGALCWILQPPGEEGKNYCHHLGMAKPLGLGAVKLEAKLHRIDRRSRYGGLFGDGNWLTGMRGEGEDLTRREVLETLTRSFEEHIIGELKPDRPCQRLRDLRRIGMLLKTMEWPGFPPDPTGDLHLGDRPNTRYMSIRAEFNDNKNEFRDRPVLPDPSAFGDLSGDAEPTIDLETDPPASRQAEQAAEKPSRTAAEMEPESAESIRKSIQSLRGAGEVSQVDGITSRINDLTNEELKRDCAEKLREWLVRHKLWKSEKHQGKEWRRALGKILDDPPQPLAE